jgi:uncharacterized protein YdhG (YjbR/CyaY superfamily)
MVNQSTNEAVEQYIDTISEDKKEAFVMIREIILENLPSGFQEELSYGMLGFVVPHTIYPKGYHCNPKLPLPFISLAAQKNFIALYHMGIYAKPELLEWFVEEHEKISDKKLDMGKSCIRFKKNTTIPYELIAQLCQKMTPEDWINTYENSFNK